MSSLPITVEAVRAALRSPGVQFTSGPIDTSRARPAGVAVPLSLGPEPRIHLVLRSSHLADHAGEIAFPGGKYEPGDENLRATAGRELFEEVGISEDQIAWLGSLSPCPVITGSYVIHPFVALLEDGVTPRVASGEIAEVLSLPIAPYVAGEEPMRAIEVPWNGVKLLAPHFPIGGRTLYGATAYITYELLVRLCRAMGRALAPPVIEDAAPWGKRYG